MRRALAAKVPGCLLTLLIACLIWIGVLIISALDTRSLWISKSWGILCDETVYLAVDSPSGEYTAEVVRLSCAGAAGSWVTHARLTRHGNWALGFKAEAVFSYVGIPPMEIVWKNSKHLLVKFPCQGVARGGPSWEGVTLEYQRVEPAIGQCRLE